jgi:putative FmdB family regulatory protein
LAGSDQRDWASAGPAARCALPEEGSVPRYDYRCEAGHRYEKTEPFGSPAQQPCEKCGKPAQRQFGAPSIVFKGSGWYSTDSQRTLRSGVGTVRDSDGGDSSSDSGDDSDSAPAPATKKKAAPKASSSKPAPRRSSKAASDD